MFGVPSVCEGSGMSPDYTTAMHNVYILESQVSSGCPPTIRPRHNVYMFGVPSVCGGSGVSPDTTTKALSMFGAPSAYGGSGVSPDYTTEA